MNKLLLIVAAGILLVSCSKKNTPAPSIAFVGKWYAKADTIREFQDNVLTETDFTTSDHTDYIQFNSDKTGITVTNGVLSAFTYTYSGNTITVIIPYKNIVGTNAPLTETIIIKGLTTGNLTLASTVTVDLGTGVLLRETENESFEK